MRFKIDDFIIQMFPTWPPDEFIAWKIYAVEDDIVYVKRLGDDSVKTRLLNSSIGSNKKLMTYNEYKIMRDIKEFLDNND